MPSGIQQCLSTSIVLTAAHCEALGDKGVNNHLVEKIMTRGPGFHQNQIDDLFAGNAATTSP